MWCYVPCIDHDNLYLERKEITRNKVLLLAGLCSLFRNKDGFLTMGEIKLVNKNATKNEIKVISQ